MRPRPSQRLRRILEAHLDSEPTAKPAPTSGAPEGDDWTIDDAVVVVGSEPPGEPVPGGAWEMAREFSASYEFADPAIIRAVYYDPTEPLDSRTMLLDARFYGLRFLLGVRTGDVVDTIEEVDGRRVRVWRWSYRTLPDHLETGQMSFAVRKWLDDGRVDFRVHAWSRPAHIPNPLIRLGFAVFGRPMQRRFFRRALERMKAHVEGASARATETSTAPPRSEEQVKVVAIH